VKKLFKNIGLEEMFVRLAEILRNPSADNRYLIDYATLRALIDLAAVGVEIGGPQSTKRATSGKGRPRGSIDRDLDAIDQQLLDRVECAIRSRAHDLLLGTQSGPFGPTTKFLDDIADAAYRNGDLPSTTLLGSHKKRLQNKWKQRNALREPTMANILLFGDFDRPRRIRKK
jgi:hypothetical protein